MKESFSISESLNIKIKHQEVEVKILYTYHYIPVENLLYRNVWLQKHHNLKIVDLM